MLTHAQLTVLKAAILAEPSLAEALSSADDIAIASFFNEQASPSFVVWKSSLTPEEARTAISGGDGLSQLDNLTAGKRDSLLWLFEGETHPSNEAQRAAIQGLCGTQNTLKAAILAAQKRMATRFEKLFAVGTGTDASPATLTVEGELTYADVSLARSLP